MTDPSGPHLVLSDAQRGTETGKYQGMYSFYWSSSAWTSATDAYSLRLNGTNSTVYPAENDGKPGGFTLRCLAQNQTKNKKSLKLNKNRQTDKTKENGREEKRKRKRRLSVILPPPNR